MRAWLLPLLLLIPGCTSQAAQPAPTPAAAAQASVHPQSGLPVITLRALPPGGPAHTFRVEVARSPAEQERGLMFRTAMGPDEGMLFPYAPPQAVSFWMHNTVIPLDIIYIGTDRKVLNIAANATPYSDVPLPSAGAVSAVAESAGGVGAGAISAGCACVSCAVVAAGAGVGADELISVRYDGRAAGAGALARRGCGARAGSPPYCGGAAGALPQPLPLVMGGGGSVPATVPPCCGALAMAFGSSVKALVVSALVFVRGGSVLPSAIVVVTPLAAPSCTVSYCCCVPRVSLSSLRPQPAATTQERRRVVAIWFLIVLRLSIASRLPCSYGFGQSR
jgi:uncharacterized membrane protein (UPF0127 family)